MITTQTYVIYHEKNARFVVPTSVVSLSNYERVADIAAMNVEDAYQLTQNIHESWLKTNCVQYAYAERARSTSIGDLIMLPNGKFVAVDVFGFVPCSVNKE